MTHRATKRRTLAPVAAAVVLLLSACQGSAGDTATADKSVAENAFGGEALDNGNPTKGGSLRYGSGQAIETLDPNTFLASGAGSAAWAVYDSLMTFDDAKGTVVPGLAESLKTTDYETWTLKLRAGVTFTDGTPFNADAVIEHLTAFTSDTATAYQSGTARSQFTSAVATDDLTVTITTKGKQYDFAALLTGQFGMVPSPTAVAAQGDAYGQHPVGAGPFKVASFQAGQEVEMVRNDDYYDPALPYLDKITFVTVSSSQARISAVQSGDLDVTATLNPAEISTAESAGLTTLTQAANGFWYLLPNNAKGPVRRRVGPAGGSAGHRHRQAELRGVQRDRVEGRQLVPGRKRRAGRDQELPLHRRCRGQGSRRGLPGPRRRPHLRGAHPRERGLSAARRGAAADARRHRRHHDDQDR